MFGAESCLLDRERPTHECFGLRQAYECCLAVRVLAEGARRVVVTAGARRSAFAIVTAVYFGVRQALDVLDQEGQAIEIDGDLGMIRAEMRLVDLQCSAHQGLCLGRTLRVLEQQRQRVKISGDLGGIVSEVRLVDLQRSVHPLLSLLRAVRIL